MKIKQLTRIAVLVLSLLTVFSAASCKGQNDNTSGNGGGDEIYKTNVKGRGIASYGNFVYYAFNEIYRFNRSTNTYAPACVDPECDGTCPVEGILTEITGIYDGRLYFQTMQRVNKNVLLAYQDIVTGEIKVLKTLEGFEDASSVLTFVDGDYFYYTAMVLKSGGDAKKSEDYEKSICRIPKDGGEQEVVLKCDTAESLMMVADGKIISEVGKFKLFTTDTETGERKEFYNFTESEYSYITNWPSYLDGKLYFLADANMTEKSEYSDQTFNLLFLVSLDIKTGEAKRITEAPVIGFCITDDKIYYTPFKLRYKYIPENGEKVSNDIVDSLSDENLYACDLDGKNIKRIYTNENLILSTSDYTVINGKIIGHFYEDTDTKTNDSFFGIIDIESGELTRIEKSA